MKKSHARTHNRNLIVDVILGLVVIAVGTLIFLSFYNSPEWRSEREVNRLWAASPPEESLTILGLDPSPDGVQPGGRLMIPDILEIVNLSSSSVVVNISFAQGAAVSNGPCRVAIVDEQPEILALHEKGDYPTIGVKDDRLLNAGFFAACYISRIDPPGPSLTPAIGLGIYQVCMLDRCTQDTYEKLMSQFQNPYAVTGHYRWMLRSLYDYGIHGHPLTSVP